MLKSIMRGVYNLYDALFSRKIFFKWNRFLYNCSLRGLGIVVNSNRTEGYFLKHLLSNPGKKVILDIGGNVGNYAAEIMQLSKDVELYSFEPMPSNFKHLEEKAAKYHFKAYQLACGSMNGKIKIYDYAGEGSEHASLLKEVIESVHHKKSIEYEVGITTLDSFVKENNISKIDLLKIDTEGYEMEVLKGVIETIKANNVDIIQFEFNEMNVISRVFLKDFIDFLPDYKIYRMLQDGYLRIDDKYFAGYHEIFAFQNLIAVNKNTSLKI